MFFLKCTLTNTDIVRKIVDRLYKKHLRGQMYRGFNLMLDEIDFGLMDEKKIAEYENRGKKRLEYLHGNVVDISKEHVSEGIIDGTELSKTWFKCIKTDVFLSHSHNDAQLALLLAGWLEKI